MSTVQPVSYQPYQQNIIVNQPRMQRDWSTGLCGCFEDIMSCLAVTFCGVFYSCYLPMKADESCCLCCGMPNGAWAIALRTKIRAENAIQGSICGDCCYVTWCGPCVMCQLSREIDNIKSGKV